MKKVAIIDDEAPARSLLKQYLQGYPYLAIVGEANNGVSAVELIKTHNPDIVFLDVQMPGMSGFEVLKSLVPPIPKIIFSTAYDQYALEAFEVNAIDYLLKPYTKARFERAVNKILASEEENALQLKRLTESLQLSTQKPTKILVPYKNKYISLDLNEVVWIEAQRDYARLITMDKSYLSNFNIGQIEKKLNNQLFIRVHRSSIININFIEEISKYPSSYDVKMKNGDVVRVSRSYLDSIRALTF